MQRGGNPRSQRSDMSLSDQIYQQLKWSLIVGEHGPDSALSIRTVAERMGTSMMPVREALKRLASERALIASANRSFRVPRHDPERVSDLFFLRANLEGAATELATPRMTPAEIDQLARARAPDQQGHRERCQGGLSRQQLQVPFHHLRRRRQPGTDVDHRGTVGAVGTLPCRCRGRAGDDRGLAPASRTHCRSHPGPQRQTRPRPGRTGHRLGHEGLQSTGRQRRLSQPEHAVEAERVIGSRTRATREAA